MDVTLGCMKRDEGSRTKAKLALCSPAGPTAKGQPGSRWVLAEACARGGAGTARADGERRGKTWGPREEEGTRAVLQTLGGLS